MWNELVEERQQMQTGHDHDADSAPLSEDEKVQLEKRMKAKHATQGQSRAAYRIMAQRKMHGKTTDVRRDNAALPLPSYPKRYVSEDQKKNQKRITFIFTSTKFPMPACHYYESSEYAHVSINKVACNRIERTPIACADPLSKGF